MSLKSTEAFYWGPRVKRLKIFCLKSAFKTGRNESVILK